MTGTRVLLLNPRVPDYETRLLKRPSRMWPPISLGYIAAMLERDGTDVLLLDANALALPDDEVAATVTSYAPTVIVVSSAQHDRWQNPIPGIDHLVALSDTLSHGQDKRTVVLVGPHGTAFPDLTFERCPFIDVIVRGEPEITTVILVDALARGTSYAPIRGLSFRHESTCIHNADRALLQDLDQLPFPAYHLMPMDKYRYRGTANDALARTERFAVTITSRGCPYRCSYCDLTMLGNRYRVRSVGNVLQEIDLLVGDYGVNRMVFHDQVLTLRRERLKALCEGLIERRHDLSWLCQGVVRKFPIDLLALMKMAGCRQINFGLESGVEEVSQRMSKNSVAEFLTIWEEGKKVGVNIVPNHMVGLPGETPALARQSNEFFRQFGFKYFFASATIPYPGTKLFEIGRKDGTIADDTWESVIAAIGIVDNGFDEESIGRTMDGLYGEETRSRGNEEGDQAVG